MTTVRDSGEHGPACLKLSATSMRTIKNRHVHRFNNRVTGDAHVAQYSMFTIGCNTSVQFGIDYASFVAQAIFQAVLWEDQTSGLLSKFVEAPAPSSAGASTLKRTSLKEIATRDARESASPTA